MAIIFSFLHILMEPRMKLRRFSFSIWTQQNQQIDRKKGSNEHLVVETGALFNSSTFYSVSLFISLLGLISQLFCLAILFRVGAKVRAIKYLIFYSTCNAALCVFIFIHSIYHLFYTGSYMMTMFMAHLGSPLLLITYQNSICLIAATLLQIASSINMSVKNLFRKRSSTWYCSFITGSNLIINMPLFFVTSVEENHSVQSGKLVWQLVVRPFFQKRLGFIIFATTFWVYDVLLLTLQIVFTVFSLIMIKRRSQQRLANRASNISTSFQNSICRNVFVLMLLSILWLSAHALRQLFITRLFKFSEDVPIQSIEQSILIFIAAYRSLDFILHAMFNRYFRKELKSIIRSK